MNDPIVLAEGCDARTFNSNLKRAFKDVIKRNVRVRIINSYKFPNCYVEVWLKDREANLPLPLRQLSALEHYPKLRGRDLEVASLGNIGLHHITLFARQWENVLQEIVNNPNHEADLDRLCKTIDDIYYPTLKSFPLNSYEKEKYIGEVNKWLEANPAFGVLKEDERAIYVADCKDKGQKVN